MPWTRSQRSWGTRPGACWRRCSRAGISLMQMGNANLNPWTEAAQERDEEHRDAQWPAGVARERSRVEDAQQALPEPFEQRRCLLLVDPDSKDGQHERGHEYEADGDCTQPENDNARPARHRRVEEIPHPRADAGLTRLGHFSTTFRAR